MVNTFEITFEGILLSINYMVRDSNLWFDYTFLRNLNFKISGLTLFPEFYFQNEGKLWLHQNAVLIFIGVDKDFAFWFLENVLPQVSKEIERPILAEKTRLENELRELRESFEEKVSENQRLSEELLSQTEEISLKSEEIMELKYELRFFQNQHQLILESTKQETIGKIVAIEHLLNEKIKELDELRASQVNSLVQESQARASELTRNFHRKLRTMNENYEEITRKRKEEYETKLKEYSEKMRKEYDLQMKERQRKIQAGELNPNQEIDLSGELEKLREENRLLEERLSQIDIDQQVKIIEIATERIEEMTNQLKSKDEEQMDLVKQLETKDLQIEKMENKMESLAWQLREEREQNSVLRNKLMQVTRISAYVNGPSSSTPIEIPDSPQSPEPEMIMDVSPINIPYERRNSTENSNSEETSPAGPSGSSSPLAMDGNSSENASKFKTRFVKIFLREPGKLDFVVYNCNRVSMGCSIRRLKRAFPDAKPVFYYKGGNEIEITSVIIKVLKTLKIRYHLKRNVFTLVKSKDQKPFLDNLGAVLVFNGYTCLG